MMLQSTRNRERWSSMRNTTRKIKILLAENDMTASDLAERLNMSKSALSRKLSKNDFLESELDAIANVFGAESIHTFQWPNGRKF